MRDRGPAYSTLIAAAKVLLPLIALGLLATLFLFGRQPGVDTVPYAEIEALAEEPQVSAPAYTGTTEDGTVVRVTAEVLRPIVGRPDSFAVDRLEARIDNPDGSYIEVRARMAEFDGRDSRATTEGLTRVVASTGYRMETSGLIADLATGRIESLGPLEVQAPFGTLTAERLVASDPPGDAAARLDFTGGVRLLYDRQTPTGETDP